MQTTYVRLLPKLRLPPVPHRPLSNYWIIIHYIDHVPTTLFPKKIARDTYNFRVYIVLCLKTILILHFSYFKLNIISFINKKKKGLNPILARQCIIVEPFS